MYIFKAQLYGTGSRSTVVLDRWLAIDPIYPYEWVCSQVLFL